MKIDFIAVDKKNKLHIDYLYKIIREREFNISNIELPDYNDHKYFVENINYRKWNLIFSNDDLIGNYYISYENFIGINLITNSINYYSIIIKKSY